MRLIILAAGQGTRLRPLTNNSPKCLVELAGKPMLEWQIESAQHAGIKDIVVIGGYQIERLHSYGVTLLENPRFASTNMVQTLFCAKNFFGEHFIMSYGDIVYSPFILKNLLLDLSDISVVVDQSWRDYWGLRMDNPLLDAETLKIDQKGNLTEIGNKPNSFNEIEAQYIGLVSFRGNGVKQLTDAYDHAYLKQLSGENPFGGVRNLDGLYMTDLLQGMIKSGVSIKAHKISENWLEIDSIEDLELANILLKKGRIIGA